MEKEELVEMINSTINTNGSGAITGEALNLALQAIVETMGTGSGSGAERLQGYTTDGSSWVQTEEEQALNAELYTKIVAALEKNEPISVYAIVDISSQGAKFNITSVLVASTEGMIVIMFFADFAYSSPVPFVLQSDGSVLIGG